MQEYRDHLKEHGYVLIKNFLTPDALELCKSFLDLTLVHDMRTPETNPYLRGDVQLIRELLTINVKGQELNHIFLLQPILR